MYNSHYEGRIFKTSCIDVPVLSRIFKSVCDLAGCCGTEERRRALLVLDTLRFSITLFEACIKSPIMSLGLGLAHRLDVKYDLEMQMGGDEKARALLTIATPVVTFESSVETYGANSISLKKVEKAALATLRSESFTTGRIALHRLLRRVSIRLFLSPQFTML